MILDEIIEYKKKEVALMKRERFSLKEKLAEKDLTLLAEIKKASPSRGLISKEFRPAEQLAEYEKGGADAVSVLTDENFFQGSTKILKELRELTELPLLRKEFIIDPLQIYESYFIGADLILLIAAVLDKKELDKFLDICRELKLEAIVEVHNLEELEKVLTTDAEIIGINNRNLKTFEVDLNTTAELSEKIVQLGVREDYYIIAESGIKTAADIDFIKKAGADGVLIGETLMRAESASAAIRELGIKKEVV